MVGELLDTQLGQGGSPGAAGAQTGRRVEGVTLVVELAIPRERYADFRREVERLGDYRPESESVSLPDTVRVAVRVGS